MQRDTADTDEQRKGVVPLYIERLALLVTSLMFVYFAPELTASLGTAIGEANAGALAFVSQLMWGLMAVLAALSLLSQILSGVSGDEI